jgi:hypothetical protein
MMLLEMSAIRGEPNDGDAADPDNSLLAPASNVLRG